MHRLEGEKMGLEKVLEVKTKSNDQSSSPNKRNSGGKKRGKGKDDNEDEEPDGVAEQDDDDDDEEMRKKEKESIEKIVKEHIQKLGLTNQTLAVQAAAAAVMPAVPILSQSLIHI